MQSLNAAVASAPITTDQIKNLIDTCLPEACREAAHTKMSDYQKQHPQDQLKTQAAYDMISASMNSHPLKEETLDSMVNHLQAT